MVAQLFSVVQLFTHFEILAVPNKHWVGNLSIHFNFEISSSKCAHIDVRIKYKMRPRSNLSNISRIPRIFSSTTCDGDQQFCSPCSFPACIWPSEALPSNLSGKKSGRRSIYIIMFSVVDPCTVRHANSKGNRLAQGICRLGIHWDLNPPDIGRLQKVGDCHLHAVWCFNDNLSCLSMILFKCLNKRSGACWWIVCVFVWWLCV